MHCCRHRRQGPPPPAPPPAPPDDPPAGLASEPPEPPEPGEVKLSGALALLPDDMPMLGPGAGLKDPPLEPEGQHAGIRLQAGTAWQQQSRRASATNQAPGEVLTLWVLACATLWGSHAKSKRH